MYVIFVTLNLMFLISIEKKYAKPDFVKFISLEINYFVGTGCFVFKKYRHAFLSGNKTKLPFPLFISFIFIYFYPSLLSPTITAKFLGLDRD